MYIAKIHDKSFDAGVLRVQVEFTDGVISLFESCVPQDEGGLKYWIKGRLDQLNFATNINIDYPDGQIVDVSVPVVTPPIQTPEQIAQDKWLAQYTKWVKIKTTLIDTGILTGTEPKLVTLKGKVQSDYLPSYIDLL
jgi:hypothetical protein